MRPFDIPSGLARPTKNTSFGAVKGINNRVAPEIADKDSAIELINYFQFDQGALEKAGGQEVVIDIGGFGNGTLLKKFNKGEKIMGWDDEVYFNDGTTDTLLHVFTTDDNFSGVKVGDFFYICNGGDKIGILVPNLTQKFLSFTGGAGTDFVVGDVITDDSTSAIGTVDYITYTTAGTIGLLVLSGISGGSFNGGSITSSGGGTASGSIFEGDFYEIPDAPKVKVLHAFGSLLIGGNTDSDVTEIVYAERDTDSTEIPFLNWTSIGSPALANDPGSVNYRAVGEVKTIFNVGEQIGVGYEDGKAGFLVGFLDIAGSGLAQKVDTAFQKEDAGMEQGAIITPVGVFYVNEEGLTRFITGGSTDNPFSTQEESVTNPVFSDDFVRSVDWTDSSLVFDSKRGIIFVTCKLNSDNHDLIIAYNINNNSITKLPNRLLSRLMKDGNTIYGISSVKKQVVQLFDTYEFEGTNLNTQWRQEIQLSDLNSNYGITETELKGFFNTDSDLKVGYDIYDKFGNFIIEANFFTLNQGEIAAFSSVGIGELPIGEGAIGGASSQGNPVEVLAKSPIIINDFVRIIRNVTSNDKVFHKITWVREQIELQGNNETMQNSSKLSTYVPVNAP